MNPCSSVFHINKNIPDRFVIAVFDFELVGLDLELEAAVCPVSVLVDVCAGYNIRVLELGFPDHSF